MQGSSQYWFVSVYLKKNISKIHSIDFALPIDSVVVCAEKISLRKMFDFLIMHIKMLGVISMCTESLCLCRSKVPFQVLLHSLLGSPWPSVWFSLCTSKRVHMGQKIHGLALLWAVWAWVCVCVVFFVLLRAFGAHGLLRTLSPYLEVLLYFLPFFVCAPRFPSKRLRWRAQRAMWCDATLFS